MGQLLCRENKYRAVPIKGHKWIKVFCLYTRLSETKMHLQKEWKSKNELERTESAVKCDEFSQ